MAGSRDPLPIWAELLKRTIAIEKRLNEFRTLQRLYPQWNENTPAQITANQDDYDPGNYGILRLSTDASRTITGLTSGTKGRILQIINVGTNDVVLAHQDAGSVAANRIICCTGADMTVNPNSACWLEYDSTTARWRAFPKCSGGTFAEIYINDSVVAQSIPTGAAYTKITLFTLNGLSRGITADVANDRIVLDATGIYKVSGSFNFYDSVNNVTWRFAAFLNGVEQAQVHLMRKIGTAADIGSASFTGFIDVTTAGVALDVRARHDNGGAVNLIVEYANFNAMRIGGT